jgi:hypothetical protein
MNHPSACLLICAALALSAAAGAAPDPAAPAGEATAPAGAAVGDVVAYANGGYYRGGLQDGARHGQGTYLYPDYSIYTGEWKAGLKHGWGVYQWPSGNIYEGAWREGVMHGEGTLTFADGGILEGRWVDGTPPSATAPAAPGPGDAPGRQQILETRCRLVDIVSDAQQGFAPYFAARAAAGEDAADAGVVTRAIDERCR